MKAASVDRRIVGHSFGEDGDAEGSAATILPVAEEGAAASRLASADRRTERFELVSRRFRVRFERAETSVVSVARRRRFGKPLERGGQRSGSIRQQAARRSRGRAHAFPLRPALLASSAASSAASSFILGVKREIGARRVRDLSLEPNALLDKPPRRSRPTANPAIRRAAPRSPTGEEAAPWRPPRLRPTAQR